MVVKENKSWLFIISMTLALGWAGLIKVVAFGTLSDWIVYALGTSVGVLITSRMKIPMKVDN
jgi:hypothetical protein